jgi:PKD repeat protein
MKKLLLFTIICSFLVLTSCKKATEQLQPENNSLSGNTNNNSNQALDAKFSITTSDPLNIFENQSIRFNNLSTGFTSCVWEFGNATKSQQANPEISYPIHGFYTVKLTVFDGKGNKKIITQDVSILCLFYNGVHPSGGSETGR